VAGVGNIYAAEALVRARVHPRREARRLTRAQWTAVHAGVLEALRAGLAADGASIDDYRDPDGARGSFQDEFLVHRREGEPCPRCGARIRKLTAAGRGTYACPRCQRAPRLTTSGALSRL
jgi:formamidopyrimidine-DNA glycosylase